MANTSRIRGFKPLGYLNGAAWNGQVNQYLIPSTDATAVFVGDPVASGSAGGAAGVVVNGQNCEGMPVATRGVAGSAIRGIVVGFLPKQSDLTVIHREASTNRIALVVDDPNVLFEVEANGVGIAAADIALNANFALGSGSTTTGQSGATLDVSSLATTVGLNCKVLGLVKRVDNEINSADKVVVMINNHELRAGAVGVA